MAVVQAGDDRGRWRLRLRTPSGAARVVGVDRADGADGEDRVPVDEHRAGVEDGGPAGHGQDDAVADQVRATPPKARTRRTVVNVAPRPARRAAVGSPVTVDAPEPALGSVDLLVAGADLVVTMDDDRRAAAGWRATAGPSWRWAAGRTRFPTHPGCCGPTAV